MMGAVVEPVVPGPGPAPAPVVAPASQPPTIWTNPAGLCVEQSTAEKTEMTPEKFENFAEMSYASFAEGTKVYQTARKPPVERQAGMGPSLLNVAPTVVPITGVFTESAVAFS